MAHVKKIIYLALFSLFFVFAPVVSEAHQPRITESRQTFVKDPDISKAYYGKLSGEPDVYFIQSSKPFDLYVNVLVPDVVGQKKDISAVILKDGKQLVVLDGKSFEWKKFYELFGADSYWMGPEYKEKVDAGSYEIRVSSEDNKSKYSLAIGELESFDFKETINALNLIPKIKRNFFEESSFSFIKSPFGYSLIIIMYVLAFIFGLVYRKALRLFARGTVRDVRKNIGVPDRLLRLLISIGLLLWAVTTTWSMLIIFFSGFCLFESIYSWCGFYAAIGKNTCPM